MSESYTAGHELDALVCRTFGIAGTIEFGARAPYRGEETYWSFSDDRRELEMTIAAVKEGWRLGSVVEEITHYPRVSEDIAAAWLVVERLLADDWGFDLRNYGTWTAVLEDGRSSRYVTEDGGTAPLAICRAALAATPSEPPSVPSGGPS